MKSLSINVYHVSRRLESYQEKIIGHGAITQFIGRRIMKPKKRDRRRSSNNSTTTYIFIVMDVDRTCQSMHKSGNNMIWGISVCKAWYRIRRGCHCHERARIYKIETTPLLIPQAYQHTCSQLFPCQYLCPFHHSSIDFLLLPLLQFLLQSLHPPKIPLPKFSPFEIPPPKTLPPHPLAFLQRTMIMMAMRDLKMVFYSLIVSKSGVCL